MNGASDWFNLETGEALAEYTPSPVMRELVLGIELQSADPHLSASMGSTREKHALNRGETRTQLGETRTSTRV